MLDRGWIIECDECEDCTDVDYSDTDIEAIYNFQAPGKGWKIEPREGEIHCVCPGCQRGDYNAT